jgi:hypothetical protein
MVFWLPALFTPGRLILALPSNETPPIVLAVVRVAALPVMLLEVNATVPVASGKVIVRSAVGSVMVSVVSWMRQQLHPQIL